MAHTSTLILISSPVRPGRISEPRSIYILNWNAAMPILVPSTYSSLPSSNPISVLFAFSPQRVWVLTGRLLPGKFSQGSRIGKEP